MMGLKYIEEEGILENNSEPLNMEIGLSMEHFSVYQNIGLVECALRNNFTDTPLQIEEMHRVIRPTEMFTEMYLQGLFPQLLKE